VDRGVHIGPLFLPPYDSRIRLQVFLHVMGDVGTFVTLLLNREGRVDGVFSTRNRGRDRSTARLTLGVGLAVSAFPLSVPV